MEIEQNKHDSYLSYIKPTIFIRNSFTVMHKGKLK
jgi:hypothetical protein